jgi:hypothetical protein
MNTYELKISVEDVGFVHHYIETDESDLEIRLREICSHGVLIDGNISTSIGGYVGSEDGKTFIPGIKICWIKATAIERSQYNHQDVTVTETIKQVLITK